MVWEVLDRRTKMNIYKSRIRKATLRCLLIGLSLLAFVGMAKAKDLCVEGYDMTYQARFADPTDTAIIAMGSGSPGLIEGTVTFVGVLCGPDIPSRVPPCNGPYPNYEIVVYKADGVTVETQVNSDKNGNYRISLIPGHYVIYTSSGPVMKKTNTVNIVSGKTTRLDLMIDSGIRSDVPMRPIK
jgi:hypothetical protein